MTVLSSTSPLNYLTLIGHVRCLEELYWSVVTTPTVLEELQPIGSSIAVRSWAQNPPHWLVVESPGPIAPERGIHAGEASVLALARERAAGLILFDDRAAHRLAVRWGLATTGTLGVLVAASLKKLLDLDRAPDLLQQRTTFYATPKLYAQLRQTYGGRSK